MKLQPGSRLISYWILTDLWKRRERSVYFVKYLSVNLCDTSIHLSIYSLFIHAYIHHSIYLSIYPFIHNWPSSLSIHLSIYSLFIRSYIHHSIHLYIRQNMQKLVINNKMLIPVWIKIHRNQILHIS